MFVVAGAGVGLFVLFLVLLITAPTFARSAVAPVRAWLVQAATQSLSDRINGTLQVGALQGSLLRAPRVADVVLRDPTGAVVVRIDAVRLHYGPLSLLRGRLVIHEIKVIRPQLSLMQGRDGTLNLARLVRSASQPADPGADQSGPLLLPIGLELGRLRVQDGRGQLALDFLKGVTAVSDVQMTLEGRTDDSGLHLTIQELSAQTHPAQVNLTELRGALRLTESQLQIEQLQFRTQNTQADFNALLSGGPHPVQITARLRPLDTGEIGRLLAKDTLQGELQLDLQAQGPLSDIGFQADLRADAGHLGLQGRLNAAENPARYRGTITAQRLNLAALAARDALKSDLNMVLDVDGRGLSPQTLEGQLNVSVQPSHLGDITLDASQIRIVAQSERIHVEALNLVSSLAAVTASGSLDFRGASDLAYEARANLDQLQPLLGVESLNGSLHLQGSAEGAWPDLRAAGKLIAAEVQFDTNRLQRLELDYQASQLGAAPKASAHLHLRDLAIGGLPAATAVLQAAYEGSRQQATFTAQVTQPPRMESHLAGRVVLGDAARHVVLDTVEFRFEDRTWHAPEPLEATVKSGAFNIKSFRLTHGEESVSLTGGIENQSFRGARLAASSLDLTYLKGKLGLPDPVAGRVSLVMQADGAFGEPGLRGSLRITPSAGEELPFDRLLATVQYESKNLTGQISARQDDRDVIQADFQAPLDLALVDVPLHERLLDAPLRLSLRIRQPSLSSLQAIAPGPALAGTLQGDVTLLGTYTHLRLTSDIDLQNVGVQGVVEALEAPLRMTAELETADSIPALAEALISNTLAPRLRRLDLHVASVSGRLPAADSDQAAQPIGIDKVRLTGDAAWNADGLQATIASFQAETEAFNLPPTALSASAHLTQSQFDLRHAQVVTPKSRVEAKGRMTLADRRFDLELDVPRLNLAEFVPALPPSLSRDVKGNVRLGGSVSEPTVAARLRYGEMDVHVQGSVDLQRAAYSADLALSQLAIDRFLPTGAGTLNARLTLKGSGFAGPDRRTDLRLSFNAPDFNLAPELSGGAQAALTGSAVSLDELRIDSMPVQLTVAGALSQNRELQADYQVIFKDLASFGPRLGAPVQASGGLTGSISGPLDALRIQGQLRLENWAYGDFRGEEASATFEGEDLTTKPRATLTASFDGVQGSALPASSATFDGRYGDRQAQVEFSVTGGPYEQTHLAGRVALQEDQDVNLDTLRLQYRHWRWENPDPVRIVRQADGIIRFDDFHLQYGEQAIRASGSVHPSGPLAASLVVHQVDIEPWLHAFVPAVAASGRLSLDLAAAGRVERPEVTGVVQLSGLAWNELPLGRMRVDVGFADDRLENHLQWRDGDRELLEVKGTLGLRDDYPLDLKASSSFDLARLAPLFDVVEQSGGSLDLRLHVGGTVKAPDIKGGLAIRGGVLRLVPTGEPYHDIQAQLTLTNNRLDIDRLSAASSTGTLRTSGWLETDGLRLKHLQISLQAQEFTALHTASVQARLTGAVEARGSLDALALKGDLSVPRARIRVDHFGAGPASVSPSDLTVSGVYGGDPEETESATEEAEPESPVMRILQTKLRVRLPRNVWVVGPETAVEVQGSLRVDKNLNEPFVIGGSVQAVRGFVTFKGRKFDLERGQVTFTGADEINPILDVVGRHDVSDYAITLHVEGESRRPRLTFHSTPDLPDEDILSLLAFGKTIDRLSGSEQTALSAQGAAIAGNILSGILEKRVGNTLGLDTLEVDVGDELGTGSVRGGRYVTQDLFLSYERQLGEQSGNTVEVEYSLGPRVKLKGASDDQGQSSLDLFWRIEY